MKHSIDWEKIVHEQKSDPRSIREYCKEMGVSTASFYLYRKRLGLSPVKSKKNGKLTHFAEVKISNESLAEKPQPKIRLHTPDGYTLEVYL